jgi:CHAT domain-containing protein/tetratricopeptide (TPR) repeat protein
MAIAIASLLPATPMTDLANRLSPLAQSEPQVRPLLSGQALERDIAGGESHTYQIQLTAGQFLRLVTEPKAIDVAMVLVSPDGKQLLEANLTGASGREAISAEAAASGEHRLTIRAVGSATLTGSYRVYLEVKASATAQDRQRLAAEALMLEANELQKHAGKTAEQVIDKLQQALPVWRELNEPYWAAWSLVRIGAAYYDQSRFEKAIDYYEQALKIARETKDRITEGRTLNNLGNANNMLSRLERAIDYYEQALPIFREVKDRASEGRALNNLGRAYESLGRYERAIERYEQALRVVREAKDRATEGRALGNLGSAYDSLGRYERAIDYYEQSLVIHREVKNRISEGGTLLNLGIAYRNLGRPEKAITNYEQALVIFREENHRAAVGLALNSLGSAYYDLSRYEKAIDYYEQALALHREVKNRDGETSTLNNLGSSYEKVNRHEQALAAYQQALVLAREIKARGEEIAPLLNLGTIYRFQSQYEKATQFHEQALAIAREVKQRYLEAEALNQMMLDWKARNQPRLAIFFGKQSVNAYQEIRSDLRSLDRESQQSFLKSKEETYRALADLLIAQGRLPEAEQVIRMLKDEEYFDFIRRDQSSSPKTAKAQLTPEEQALENRYREIADQLAALGAERSTLVDKSSRTPEEEQRLAKLEADLIVAGNAFQKFLDQLSTELKSFKEAGSKVFQLRESQGLMEDLRELGKGTVALYTLIGEDKYRVILTTADFQKGYEYPIKAADLNRKVLEFRDILQNPKYDPLPLAQELYKILVALVAKDLQATKAQTIMWSLDGVLRYLPVAALHDGNQYLVEQYRNVVFTPASQARLKDVPRRQWSALGLGVTKSHGNRIPALPGVAEEMHGIIRETQSGAGSQSGVLPGVIKLDEAFTQEAMLAGLRQRPPVVHVASHFQFAPGNETNSALLLGDGSFLSLAQIKSLPNVFGGVELLTLSACNTATGGSGANGKEVEGFGVLAQRQGAKAVVASLWPVFDASTKVLMQDFYRIREAKQDTTKAESLRQAQLRLLRGEATTEAATSATTDRKIVHEEEKSGAANKLPFKADAKKPYAHPYYWAPFILIGNWK